MHSDGTNPLQAELDVAIRLAHEAGALAMEHYDQNSYAIQDKPDDQGPVTSADTAANAHIIAGIAQAFPADAIVAEESAADAQFLTRTWFVDPIDGTKEFIAANGQFAVMIGLAIDNQAALGVVYHPVSASMSWGVVGFGAFTEQDGNKAPLSVSAVDMYAQMRIVRSRSHPSARISTVMERLGIEQQRRMGSFGLKLVEVASARAELYINLSDKASLWDGCAPHAILSAAGGTITDQYGDPVRYAKADNLHLQRGFVGSNGQRHAEIVETIRALA